MFGILFFFALVILLGEDIEHDLAVRKYRKAQWEARQKLLNEQNKQNENKGK